MAGIKNDIVFAKNADFTAANNTSPSEANGLATNGQMWIGTTNVNAGGSHVNVGNITSPDGSLTIGYSSPNITATINRIAPTSGSLVLISSQTASASSDIQFTSGITVYDVYKLLIYGVTTVGGNSNIFMQFSSDGGSTWINSNYAIAGTVQSAGSASSGGFAATGLSGILLNNGYNDSATTNFCCEVSIFNLNSTSLYKNVFYQSCGNFDSGYWTNADGFLSSAANCNAIKIFPGTGTFTVGSFKLYGVVN